MYVSDYGFSATPNNWTTNLGSYNTTTNTDNNWLYMGMTEWTITRAANNVGAAFTVGGSGNYYYSAVHNRPIERYSYGVRPVFYLNFRTKYSGGDGSRDNPLRIDPSDILQVKNVTTSNITYNSATLTITASVSSSATIAKYQYKIGNGNWLDSTSNVINLTNLTPSTNYSVKVRVIDSNNDISDEYGPVTFSTTIIRCSSGVTLANCITSQPLVTTGAGLYHHKNLTNSAEDDSYRYAGASTKVNNYVCFGSTASPCPEANLYRIIGAFKNASEDYEVKLIKADFAGGTELGQAPDSTTAMPDTTNYPNYNTTHGGYLTSVPRYYRSGSSSNQSNTWSASTLNTNTLNGTYLTNLGTEWTDKMTTHTWKVAGNDWSLIGTQKAATAYANEITTPKSDYTPQTAQAKIGLMYVSDYGFSATSNNWATNLNAYNNATNTDNNWLYMGMTEWTITRRADRTDYAFLVGSTGRVNHYYVNLSYGVRPVFYLESQATYSSGNGSRENPIRLG